MSLDLQYFVGHERMAVIWRPGMRVLESLGAAALFRPMPGAFNSTIPVALLQGGGGRNVQGRTKEIIYF